MVELKTVSNQITYGLYGTFYKGSLFEDFLLGNHGENEGGNLHFLGPKSFHKELNATAFHSARWVGQISIPEDDTYLFNTSIANALDNVGSEIDEIKKQIEEKTSEAEKKILEAKKKTLEETKELLEAENLSVYIRLEREDKKFDVLNPDGDGLSRTPTDLKKGIYNIRIEYLPIYPILDNQNVLQVMWQPSKTGQEEVIPKKNFLLPNAQTIGNPTYIKDTLFETILLPQNESQNISNQAREEFFASLTATDSFLPLNEEPLVAESDDIFTSDTKIAPQTLQDVIAAHKKDREQQLKTAKLQVEGWGYAYEDLHKMKSLEEWFKTYENLLDPDYDVKNPFAKYADANGDGLTNFDSTNGFCVSIEQKSNKPGSNNEAIGMRTHVPWRSELGGTRYRCSFTQASTTGDPYTDLQKAFGNIMNISDVAKHPLVAACPFVSAQMEGYSIVPIESTTVGTEKGLHATTGNRLTITNTKDGSTTKDNSLGKSLNLGGSSSGPTAGIGINTSQSLSNTEGRSNSHSIDSTSDVTQITGETVQRQFSTGERATFGAYIRYVNTGTAAILNGIPTLNFVAVKDNNPIMTVRPPDNSAFEVQELSGDSMYPSEDLGALFLQTADAFGSVKMSLNSALLDKAKTGGVRLQVPQVAGFFSAHPNAANDPSIPNGNERHPWATYYEHIWNNTAHITLITPDGKIYDRHIAAPTQQQIKDIETNKKNKKNKKTPTAKYDLYYVQHAVHPETPLLTIGEAIQIAFGKNHKDFMLENAGVKYDLFKNVSVNVNQATAQLLEGQKSKMTHAKTIYDYDLYQGMRIVVEVQPTVTLSLQYTPKEPYGFDKYIVLHNETDKELHYTASVSPALNPLENGKELFSTGILKPNEMDPKKISFDTITDQDILKIYTGDKEGRQNQELVWNKHIAKVPGFVKAKHLSDLTPVKESFKFLNWIGDFTGQSKCRGIELFVHPKENWNNIASFTLQIEKAETKETIQYSPIARAQLTPLEYTNDGKEGYKVSIDFSMFKDLQTTSINFGDTFTLTGTIDEEPEYTWAEFKDCGKGTPEHCHFDQLAKPQKDPRTCEISKDVFNPSFSKNDYEQAFQHLTFNLAYNVKSLVNGDKVSFPTVYKTLSGKIENSLILGTIKEYKIKLNGSDIEKQMKIKDFVGTFLTKGFFAPLLSPSMNVPKSPDANLPNYHLGFGNIEFSFHTDTMITQEETVPNEEPIYEKFNLMWKLGKAVGIVPEGVDGSHTEAHSYNASVDGLLPGTTVEILAVVDKNALSAKAQIEANLKPADKTVEISIFKKGL
ncbi:hypothetical protein OCF15_28965 [Bacillus cereus]|nr:hypothetical protein [Bacillus cereus]